MRTHEEYRLLVEKRLSELSEVPHADFAAGETPRLLAEAMRYSLMAGGKRLRPCMLLAACELLGGDIAYALDFACAIEMIHTYSLIHDDLPGMDNDTLRRGKPTNHVVYGVGQAILAGDGLLTLAFEQMTKTAAARPDMARASICAMGEIARGAGVTGMVAGQCCDLYCEGENGKGEALLDYIHAGKTMAMFRGAVLAGAALAGADENSQNALKEYCESFGRLFQVTDDILDVTADSDFGKSKGKDAQEGKLTAVSTFGLEKAEAYAAALKDRAIRALDCFDEKADYFRNLVTQMYERKH